MSTRLTTWFLLMTLAAHAHAVCPLRPGSAQLQEAARDDEDFLRKYAISRLLACGFADARSDLELALPLPGTDVSAFGHRDASDLLLKTNSALSGHVLLQRPREFVAEYAREQSKQSAALRLTPAGHAGAATRLEHAVPDLVALLRERLPADQLKRLDTHFERVLIAHEVRTGFLDQARARLEHLSGDPRLNDAPRFYQVPRDWVAQTREALALPSPMAPPMSDWVIDLTGNAYKESCLPWSFGDVCALQPAGLRADMLLGNGDRTGAITVLLRNEWARTMYDMVSCNRQLGQLLGERYSPDALRAGWAAAERSVRIAGADSGFVLYGVELPLPRAALVVDASTGEAVERPLTLEQALNLIRKSDLYHALFVDADDAR
jgi:hypothetical protein